MIKNLQISYAVMMYGYLELLINEENGKEVASLQYGPDGYSLRKTKSFFDNKIIESIVRDLKKQIIFDKVSCEEDDEETDEVDTYVLFNVNYDEDDAAYQYKTHNKFNSNIEYVLEVLEKYLKKRMYHIIKSFCNF